MNKILYTVLSICTALGLASMANAQKTMPAGLSLLEGSTHFHVPQYSPSRFQTIYSSKLIPANLTAINGFKLRADGVITAPMVAHTFKHTVRLSNRTAAPLQGYGIRWATNHGQDMAIVLNNKTVNWPTSTVPVKAPATFLVDFPLTKPFLYKGNSIVLDISVDSTQATPVKFSWYVDSELGKGGVSINYGKAIRTGKGCPHDTKVQENRFTVNGYYPHLNGPLYFFGDSQAKQQKLIGLCLIGDDAQTIGGFPLPFSLAPLGAYGCNLYTNALFAFPATTDPSSARGRITFDIGNVPADQALTGQKVSTQLIVHDPAYNTLGLRTSDLMTWIVGIGFSGSVEGYSFYAYQASSTSPKVDPDFCTYSNNFVPVVQLY